jgi:hypothetical protein
MRTKLLIIVLAALFGLAGGYAWSTLTAPVARAPKPPKAGFMALPASPEERPAALDEEWTSRSVDEPSAPTAATASAVHYSGCNAVRAAGKAPLYEGEPGYSEKMDGDGDGIACEPIRAN